MSYLTDKILEELLDNIPDGPEKEPKRKVNPYATVQEQNNKHNEGRLTQAQIIEDFIRRLLDDPIDEEEEDEYDPNVLDPAIVFQEDTKFINGVKKMPSASRPMKSASLPPMISEVEIMTDIANCEFSKLYDTKKEYIRVIIPGMSGDYFIKADKLKRWLDHFIEKGRIQLTENGNGLMVEMKVGREKLLANCVKRK